MARKKKEIKNTYDPNSVKDLHRYFWRMGEWYNSENLMITKYDFPKVCTELIHKFPGISEDYIYKLVSKFKSRNIIGTYNKEADPDAGKEFDE